MQKRSEVENKFKWILEDIYASETEWERDFEELSGIIPLLGDLGNIIASSAQSLAEGLKQITYGEHMMERLFVYARMRRDENNAAPTYQAMCDRATGLSVRLSEAVSFLDPLLLSLPKGTLENWIESTDSLADYDFILADLVRGKAHILTDSEEKLLSMTGDFSGGSKEAFTMLDNADMTFAEVEHNGKIFPISHAGYLHYMTDSDRELRAKVYAEYYKGYTSHLNTISALFASSVKKDVFYARARKYKSCLSKALFADNVPESVYRGLVENVNDALPTLHKYVELRGEILGIKDQKMYDIYVPLVGQVKNEFSYEEACGIVIAALAPLGDDYIGKVTEALNLGWVDVYETENKTSGAYSWGAYGTHPYVLLNHRNDLNSIFTLAHELGHALHSYYSDEALPYTKAGYPIFCAEVASTVNEILLTKYLLKTTSDESLRRFVLNHYIDQFRATVMRQTMFSEFEMSVHEMAEANEPLTAATLCEVYGNLNRKYYGEGIETDDNISAEWSRIPHFYNSFYVYKYATGFSAAVAIVKQIEEQGTAKYREFLASGGSDYPTRLLKKAGIEISDAVSRCMTEFEKALAEFAALMVE